jgi:small-conductance mechanosensitive channel
MPDDNSTSFSGPRNLAKRLQEMVERVITLSPADGASVADLAGQMRSLIETAAAASAAPAREMQVMADAVKQQRAQIQLLQQQLKVFDDQLAVLESTLKPAVEISNQWTKAHAAIIGAIRPSTDS